jgi:magnesium transporter
MRNEHKKRSKKTGMPPGTLVHIGREKTGGTKIELIEYDANQINQRHYDSLTSCPPPKPSPVVTWINVDGLSQVEVLQQFGSCYGLHPLVLEDILATDQRPKAENYGSYLYVVLKMIGVDPQGGGLRSEQVSLVLGENYLISFQEGLEGDVFEPVRVRLQNGQAKLRVSGPDLLLHALLDIIVDNYFLVLEHFAERTEMVEDALIETPTTETVHGIYQMRRQLFFLHKAVWPLREVLSGLQRSDSPLIHETSGIYLKDLYDHTIQVLDTLETLRDMLTGMLDIYLSSVSHRLNEVMKVLTIIATIFMPLSFVVGLYGMNFRYMPELQWRYGYPAVLLLLLTITVVMLVYIKKKGWL